jgi:hypothetical protein
MVFAMSAEPAKKTFQFFVSQAESAKHPGKVSVGMIERHDDSNILATMMPVGLCKKEQAVQQAELFAIKNGLQIVSKWSTSGSGRHLTAIAQEHPGYKHE